MGDAFSVPFIFSWRELKSNRGQTTYTVLVGMGRVEKNIS